MVVVPQQGLDKSRYQFVPRVLIFLTRGEDVLLIKGAPTKRVWANLYNGLGGHVERGESVWAAARREVEEESGLKDLFLWLCAVVTIDTGDAASGILMFVFRGEADGEPRPSVGGTLEWVPTSRLAALPLVEDLPTLLPRVLAMQRGDPPLWGFYEYNSEANLRISFD
jgi:8-oxo-dGTP diphosphatase